MIKIAICEPSINIANNIENLLDEASELINEIIQYDYFASGKDFFDSIDKDDLYRIIFINLDMGDIDGIDMGKKIRERFSSNETLLVYLSTNEPFSSNIFDVQPFLYIHIPFDNSDFLRKFFYAIEHLQQANNLFICKKGRTIYQLQKKEIMYIESINHDLILAASGREEIQYRATLKSEQEKLKTINFIRPHNSFIVNLDYVTEYNYDGLLMQNKKWISISELRAKETKKAILKFWEYRNVR